MAVFLWINYQIIFLKNKFINYFSNKFSHLISTQRNVFDTVLCDYGNSQKFLGIIDTVGKKIIVDS